MKFTLTLMLMLAMTGAMASQFPKTTDLEQSGSDAAAVNKVLVLYVSMPDCPHCKKLEADILQKAYSNNELDDVSFVEFEWIEQTVTDFAGNDVSAESFLNQYGIVVTPTMLFLGENGEELSDRIIGYQSEDFYWHYVRNAIAQAKEWLETAQTPISGHR